MTPNYIYNYAAVSGALVPLTEIFLTKKKENEYVFHGAHLVD
mgnify:CR=1 FL=1